MAISYSQLENYSSIFLRDDDSALSRLLLSEDYKEIEASDFTLLTTMAVQNDADKCHAFLQDHLFCLQLDPLSKLLHMLFRGKTPELLSSPVYNFAIVQFNAYLDWVRLSHRESNQTRTFLNNIQYDLFNCKEILPWIKVLFTSKENYVHFIRRSKSSHNYLCSKDIENGFLSCDKFNMLFEPVFGTTALDSLSEVSYLSLIELMSRKYVIATCERSMAKVLRNRGLEVLHKPSENFDVSMHADLVEHWVEFTKLNSWRLLDDPETCPEDFSFILEVLTSMLEGYGEHYTTDLDNYCHSFNPALFSRLDAELKTRLMTLNLKSSDPAQLFHAVLMLSIQNLDVKQDKSIGSWLKGYIKSNAKELHALTQDVFLTPLELLNRTQLNNLLELYKDSGAAIPYADPDNQTNFIYSLKTTSLSNQIHFLNEKIEDVIPLIISESEVNKYLFCSESTPLDLMPYLKENLKDYALSLIKD